MEKEQVLACALDIGEKMLISGLAHCHKKTDTVK